jgi:2'-5' RNA ligase
VRPRHARSAPAYVLRAPGTVQAHITLLGPFVQREEMDDRLLGDLRDLFAGTAPFTFTLDGPPGTLDDGTLCLEPRPAEPFVRLTHALEAAYPEHPAYGGAFAQPRPHLTLAYAWARTGSGATAAEEGLTEALAPLLPLTLTASTACLNWYAPFASETVGSFPFGG